MKGRVALCLAPGRRGARWEDRRASIVVTPVTILIHRSEELWSFEPPDGDVEGWTRDLRAVTRHALE